MTKVKRYIACMLMFVMVLSSVVVMDTKEVSAASQGGVDALVAHAISHNEDDYKLNGCETFAYDWCMSFIAHCAYKTGNTSALPYNPKNQKNSTLEVHTYSEKIVNQYKAKITFVNEKAYSAHKNDYVKATLNENYKPAKGDIVIYSWASDKTSRDHAGLVVSDKRKGEPILFLEGNTGNDSYTLSKVLYRTYEKRKNNIIAYVTPNYPPSQTFTAKYNPNCSDASGSMASTTVSYGVQTPLRTNQYIRNGYNFTGWTVQRDDGTWNYVNPSNEKQSGWYKEGKAPSGWKKYIYQDKQTVAYTHTKNKGVVTFFAQWSKTSGHRFYYKVDGVIGFQSAIWVAKGNDFAVTKIKPSKSGYTFTGWTAYRVKDKKYFVSGKGWFTEKEIQNKGYSKKIYPAGGTYTFTGSWTKGCSGNSHYVFEAQWKKNPVTTFTVKYMPNGGTGSMANTTVTYGKSTALRSNQFKKSGYTFVGWTAKRDDNTWRYISPDGTSEKWCVEGKQPSGWKKYVYKNQAKVLKTYSKNKGVVYFYAQWKQNAPQTFTVKYNANGGSGSMANTTVTYGKATPLRSNQFVRDEYKFVGWTAKRDNNTWRYIQPGGSKDGWYAEGKQPSGWKKYVYKNQENVLYTYNKDKGVVTFYAQWEKVPVHTFYYDTNGGNVTPLSMNVSEGTKFSVTQTVPKKEGYSFIGWHVYRIKDGTYYVSGVGWLSEQEIKSKGYQKRIYTPGESFNLGGAWLDGYAGVSDYIFEAQWKENDEKTYTIKYIADGGEGYMEDTVITFNVYAPLRKNQFTKAGYEFTGWTAMRDDGTWLYADPDSNESSWYTEDAAPSGWKKYVYRDQQQVARTHPKNKGIVYFVAQWKKNEVSEPVETPDPPATESEVIGFVSEEEFEQIYAGNSHYEATPYYRYATRQKEYTESTASSMAGWTLYNQVTTPGSSTWSKTKPSSGAYETGYQYYCWGWEHNGDWTFYYDNDYNNAVAWIKKNYTVWNYNQFRYFWQVYSTNKGSSVKVSQTVNYRDNAGKTGTKAISDTKLWYDGVVYRQKATTKYQYWRWSSWSSWSSWSTTKQATGDTVKEERQYYVVKK